MRVASLLPAATEWIVALGGAGDLVGRSHECDHPPEVQSLPVLTAATYPQADDARAIHNAVQERVQAGLSLYDVDLERLAALEPDLVLTQAQCEVCAASLSEIEADLRQHVPGVELFSMQPATMKAVLDTALRLGRTMNQAEAVMQYIATREQRLRQLHEAIGLERRTEPEALPSVVCIEWTDPLMVAGHWTPDVVRHGGGHALLTEPGAPSCRIAWDELAAADPDALFVMPCGFTLADTARNWEAFTSHPTWSTLRAVQADRVFVFDGNAYFNRPGPRLYRAIELVAQALHADALPVQEAAPWERQQGRPAPTSMHADAETPGSMVK
ncbi:cobalamin-binding protein [Longimonas halophila]|uniref:Cobalamin-binding protein n=1 Tax=Longimonas halophila TaxID=1469170 RepID=A0A2H3NN55_9BACT|nr:ABC transporter substrate-binding protein [Longimonas halophila]PEN08044.1 cobalamin-binding protein [Longimonas halophila]